MSEVLLDTRDLGEAEDVLGANFVKVRIRAVPGDTAPRTRVLRNWMDSLTIDDFRFNYAMSFDGDPSDMLMLCRVRSGVLEDRRAHPEPDIFRTDDVGVFGLVEDAPLAGAVHHAQYDVLQIDRKIFNEVAAGPSSGDGQVRLIGTTPFSSVANRHICGVIDSIRATAINNPEAAENALITGAMQRQLAASMLAAFPNTAVQNPTIEDRHDSTPVLLRRAIAFIEENVRVDISLADIAGAIYVTPRALQYMFRRHRDCTPIEYLRRVRLHYAHHDLIRLSRAHTTVCAIATWWGFAHVGRFAVYYRLVYGQSPHVTLDS